MWLLKLLYLLIMLPILVFLLSSHVFHCMVLLSILTLKRKPYG